MAVLSGREIRRRHLQKTVEPVKYPRRRTRNQPAFRIAGKNKLTPEEQVVYDAFMEASNGLTREIADEQVDERGDLNPLRFYRFHQNLIRVEIGEVLSSGLY